jgi:hypothetical protein
MVRAMADKPGALWLEPCIGSGVFLEALREAGVSADRIRGVDLESEAATNDWLAKTIRGVDFLKWAKKTNERFDRIVGNPPFLAIRGLSYMLRKSALASPTPDGFGVPGKANCWYAFLCASLTLLKPSGSIAFVLPAAWEYAGYAAPLRAYVTKSFAQLEVHRSRKPLFDGVQDGSIVMLCRGYQRKNRQRTRFEYSSSHDLTKGLTERRSAERTPVLTVAPKIRRGSDVCNLGDVIEIRLGGVTGDARFFALSETERIRWELPEQVMQPVVTRASHLRGALITDDEWNKLRTEGKRVWLFKPNRVLLEHPSVKRYLELEEKNGGCHRQNYKIRTRNPWYETPLPDIVDGFMSGMSKTGPWISLRSMRGLSATNTLYVIKFKERLSLEQMAAWGITLLRKETRETMLERVRKYPDGLLKYEPGDLISVRLRKPKAFQGAVEAYQEMIQTLLTEGTHKCHELADIWYKRHE